MQPSGTLATLGFEQFQRVIDCVPDALLTMDRNYVITSFNHAAEQLTGCPRAAALGRHCYEVLHEPLCDHVADCPMAAALHTADPRGAAMRQRAQQAPPAEHLHVTVRALYDESGAVSGGVELIRSTVSSPLPRDFDPHAGGDPPANLTLLETVERATIIGVLKQHRWNRDAAAKELGLSRTTLWRRMRRLVIASPGEADSGAH